MDSELKDIIKKDLNSVNKVTQRPKTITEYNTRFKNTGKAIKINKGIFKGITHDTDKDGVIDPFDCKPKDPKKQGFAHNLIKGARDKIADKIVEHRKTNELKKNIQQRIKKGELKNINQVNEEYGYGHNLRGYATQQVRNKQLSEALEKKSFEARKKALVRNQQQRIIRNITGDQNYNLKTQIRKKRPKQRQQTNHKLYL